MDEARKRSFLHLSAACFSLLLPNAVLFFCLTSYPNKHYCIAEIPAALWHFAAWVPLSVLVWRASSIEKTEKLLRLMLVIAGAAGVITPVALYQMDAYGLAGLLQLIWCALLLFSIGFFKGDRCPVIAAVTGTVAGLPAMIYAFALACT